MSGAVIQVKDNQEKATIVFADNAAETIEVGYLTKASEKLPLPVKLAGITEKAGNKTYHYIAHINHGSLIDNKRAIQELNEKGEFTSVFGTAALPTLDIAAENQLKMLNYNKESLGIIEPWIHGMVYGKGSRCYIGGIDDMNNNFKNPPDTAAYAMWKVDHSIT